MLKHRRMKWAGHVARMVVRRGAYRILVGRPDIKRQPERPRRRLDNVKIDFQEVGQRGIDIIELA